MTRVRLRVSDAAFDEIRRRLADGGADDAVCCDGSLDMSGIALVRETEHRVALRPGRAYMVWPEYERLQHVTEARLQ